MNDNGPHQRPGDDTGGSAAVTYKVVSALVIAKDIDGRLQHHYLGSVIRWLNDKQRTHFLKMGLVVELADGRLDAAEEHVGAQATT